MEEKLLSEAYPFWERLTAEERADILRSAAPVSYQKGECVHRSDMGCTGAVLVLSGLLRVYIASEEGREVTLFRIHAGEPCVLSASCLLDAIQFDLVIEAAEDVRAVLPVHDPRRDCPEHRQRPGGGLQGAEIPGGRGSGGPGPWPGGAGGPGEAANVSLRKRRGEERCRVLRRSGFMPPEM